MNSNTAVLAPDALEMLTRHNANSPRDMFQHPAPKDKISAKLTLAVHDLFKAPNYVFCIPSSIFFHIHEQISAWYPHTRSTCRVHMVATAVEDRMFPLTPQAFTQVCPLSCIKMCMSASLHPYRWRRRPSLLPDSLTFIPWLSNTRSGL